MLSSLATEIPKEQMICVFHTHVANQMPDASKEKLLETVKTIGEQRGIFHIYNNMFDAKLHMDYYLDGVKSQNTIGETDGHARWFSLNLEDPS